MPETTIRKWMDVSGVRFGTSGARGLAHEMTDRICYAYTRGFLGFLEARARPFARTVAIGGDLRPSTPRILGAVARAVSDAGYEPVYCGTIPSPALALYSIGRGIPSVMVTGSHIPADRNGIKFNKPDGELLKSDEAGIVSQVVAIPGDAFDAEGALASGTPSLPPADPEAADDYAARYLDAFGPDALHGRRIGLYQHSAVGRDLLQDLFTRLGAEVVALGRSEAFVPVDTEAIRDEDIRLARAWAKDEAMDAIVSTDGDSDRPLIANERGTWLRGDVAGILVARFLGADSVSTPVSCNTALEKSGWFGAIRRTRIGSPYVVESMLGAVADGYHRVVGYEANGGFLTASDIPLAGGATLGALPTRDAVLPILAVLLLAERERVPVSGLAGLLPPRFTASGRIENVPTETSRNLLTRLESPGAIDAMFGESCGKMASVDRTDGLRITFVGEDVLHLRPSGNAPECRCYTESESEAKAAALHRDAIRILADALKA